MPIFWLVVLMVLMIPFSILKEGYNMLKERDGKEKFKQNIPYYLLIILVTLFLLVVSMDGGLY